MTSVSVDCMDELLFRAPIRVRSCEQRSLVGAHVRSAGKAALVGLVSGGCDRGWQVARLPGRRCRDANAANGSVFGREYRLIGTGLFEVVAARDHASLLVESSRCMD